MAAPGVELANLDLSSARRGPRLPKAGHAMACPVFLEGLLCPHQTLAVLKSQGCTARARPSVPPESMFGWAGH